MIVLLSGLEHSLQLLDFGEEDPTMRAGSIQNEHTSNKTICCV